MSVRKKVNKKALKILEEVKERCSLLFKDKLQDVYLYGSYARGDYNKYSDVDIFVTLNLTQRQIIKYRYPIAEIGSDLSLKYDVTVSIATEAKNHFYRYLPILPFYKNIIKEGVCFEN